MLKEKTKKTLFTGASNWFIIFFFVIILVFPLFTFAKSYSDGALLRVENDSKVYIIHHQKKRWIRSIEIFNAYNFKWPNIKIVVENELTGMEENQLIRKRGDVKVYLISNAGLKEHVKREDEIGKKTKSKETFFIMTLKK